MIRLELSVVALALASCMVGDAGQHHHDEQDTFDMSSALLVSSRDHLQVCLQLDPLLADQAPEDALLVTESGIFTPLDVTRLERCGARAMLVGESLMRQADVAAATRALLA